MLESTLQSLCALPGVSGREDAVRDALCEMLRGQGEMKIDPLGNLIVHKRGNRRPSRRVMVDAHMDEVGVILTHIDDDGRLHFATVGGIETAVLFQRRVRFGEISGVIGGKPIHLTDKEAAKKLPDPDALTIDVGARDRAEAEALLAVGDVGYLEGSYTLLGDDCILARAIDDRAGCAVLATLLCEEAEYDFDAVFSVQEEVGARGARTAAFALQPDAALVLEATTAADLASVSPAQQVCRLGAGPAVSFLDRGTLYDRAFYEAALQSGVPCQPKAAATGGNDAGGIHLAGAGVRTLAVSLPCRYLHSPSCVASRSDLRAMLELTRYLVRELAAGRPA